MQFHLTILSFLSDEDLAGDHLLAETKFPLEKILPQMNKKFQVPLEKPCLKVSTEIKTKLMTSPSIKAPWLWLDK